MSTWLYLTVAIIGMTGVTILARGLFFVLPASVELPAGVERALRYAPACALTAIIAPGVFAHDGHVSLAWANPRLWAAVAAGLVYARTRSMIPMLAVGMAVFTALRLTTG